MPGLEGLSREECGGHPEGAGGVQQGRVATSQQEAEAERLWWRGKHLGPNLQGFCCPFLSKRSAVKARPLSMAF